MSTVRQRETLLLLGASHLTEHLSRVSTKQSFSFRMVHIFFAFPLTKVVDSTCKKQTIPLQFRHLSLGDTKQSYHVPVCCSTKVDVHACLHEWWNDNSMDNLYYITTNINYIHDKTSKKKKTSISTQLSMNPSQRLHKGRAEICNKNREERGSRVASHTLFSEVTNTSFKYLHWLQEYVFASWNAEYPKLITVL